MDLWVFKHFWRNSEEYFCQKFSVSFTRPLNAVWHHFWFLNANTESKNKAICLNASSAVTYLLNILRNRTSWQFCCFIESGLRVTHVALCLTLWALCSLLLFLDYDQHFFWRPESAEFISLVYQCMMRPLLKNSRKTPRPSVRRNVHLWSCSYVVHTVSLTGIPFLHSCVSNDVMPVESSYIPVTN